MAESKTLVSAWPQDRQSPASSRSWLRGLELATLGLILSWALLVHVWWLPVPPRNDFGKFYYSARLWLQGDSLYGPSLATWCTQEYGFGIQLWNLNPPHFHLLILPFASTLPETAYLLWLGLNFLAGMAALQWIMRTLGWKLPTGGRLAWLIAALLTATPTWATAATGQFTGLLMLLVTWIWREWRAERWERAAIGIGIACSVKVFFAPLLIYLLVTRRWRPAFVALASCGACFGVGLAVFGWAEHVAWLRVLTEVSWLWFPMNASIVAPFTRAVYGAFASYDGLPDTTMAVRVGLMVAAPLAVAGGIVAWRDRNHERALLVLLTTILLTFPTGWLYYLWILAGPLAGLWHHQGIRRTATAISPAAFLPFWWLWPIESALFGFTLGSLFTWCLLAFWVATLRTALQARTSQTTPAAT